MPARQAPRPGRPGPWPLVAARPAVHPRGMAASARVLAGLGLPMQSSAVEHDLPRCGRRKRRPRAAVGVLALGSVYALLVRPRLLRWGASDDELDVTVPGRWSRARRRAHRHDGGDHRRAAEQSVALARADGHRPGRLVQLGPAGQLRPSQRGPDPSRVAKIDLGDRFTGKPDGSQSWQVAAVEPERFLALRMSPTCGADSSTLRAAAAPVHGLDVGFPPHRAAGTADATPRQRVLGVAAALAAAPRERRRPGAGALGDAARQFANLKRRAEAPPGRAEPEAPAGRARVAATPRRPRSAGRRA